MQEAPRDDLRQALPTNPRVVSPSAVTSAWNGPRGGSGARTKERSGVAAARLTLFAGGVRWLAESPHAATQQALATHASITPAARNIIGRRKRI